MAVKRIISYVCFCQGKQTGKRMILCLSQRRCSFPRGGVKLQLKHNNTYLLLLQCIILLYGSLHSLIHFHTLICVGQQHYLYMSDYNSKTLSNGNTKVGSVHYGNWYILIITVCLGGPRDKQT